MVVLASVGFWSRLFTPSRETVADVTALAAATVEPKPHTEDLGQIIQPGSTMWRTYPEETITPESLRRMQKDADLGFTWQLMELYDSVAMDYHVAAQLRTRKLAVAGAPMSAEGGKKIRGGKKSGQTAGPAQKIADEFLEFWQRIPDATQLLCDILDDFYRGFSCVRPIWDAYKGGWQIVDHEAVESRYFRFLNGTDPVITRVPGAGEGVPIPDGYIYSECRDKAGPVVRAGAGRSVSKLWVHKGYALVDTASYIERYGSPHVQATTPRMMREGDPELERIKDAARAFISDQIGIVPDGTKLEIIDALNKGTNVRDVYLAYMSFLEMGISKAIVGQTLTADAGPGGIGHGGAAGEHGDVRQDLKEYDARRLAHIVQTKIAAPWTLYHHGPNAPVPYICFNVSKPEDRVQATLAAKQEAETINILRSSGLPISKSDMYERFDLEEPDTDDDTLVAIPVPATDAGDPQKGVPDPSKPGQKQQPANGGA